MVDMQASRASKQRVRLIGGAVQHWDEHCAGTSSPHSFTTRPRNLCAPVHRHFCSSVQSELCKQANIGQGQAA